MGYQDRIRPYEKYPFHRKIQLSGFFQGTRVTEQNISLFNINFAMFIMEYLIIQVFFNMF